MNIKKVDDKPMVIHTKEKHKLHVKGTPETKIRGRNVLTVQHGPKTARTAAEKSEAWSGKIKLKKNSVHVMDKRKTGQMGTSADGMKHKECSGTWITSPYCQIEPAMAFQFGLPVLVLRENGVLEDEILEKGVLGIYMPEFSIEYSFSDYFETDEFQHLLGKWEGRVRNVVEKKGNLPQFF